MYQHVHPHTKSDLTVTVILPEEFLDKTVRISFESVLEKEATEKSADIGGLIDGVITEAAARHKENVETAIKFFRSHQVDLSGYTFNREEANER